MRLKLYRAATAQAAMTMIRAELGEESFILSTRRVAGGVEIAAARDEGAGSQPCAVPGVPRRVGGIERTIDARHARGRLGGDFSLFPLVVR